MTRRPPRWPRAGSGPKVTLEPAEQDFSVIPEKPPDFDVTLSLGADWLSIGTAIPPLYDSRVTTRTGGPTRRRDDR